MSPTYRADWLREDLLRLLGMIQDARVEIAQGRTAEFTLRYAATELARVIAHPHIPDLADALAARKADALAPAVVEQVAA